MPRQRGCLRLLFGGGRHLFQPLRLEGSLARRVGLGEQRRHGLLLAGNLRLHVTRVNRLQIDGQERRFDVREFALQRLPITQVVAGLLEFR